MSTLGCVGQVAVNVLCLDLQPIGEDVLRCTRWVRSEITDTVTPALRFAPFSHLNDVLSKPINSCGEDRSQQAHVVALSNKSWSSQTPAERTCLRCQHPFDEP